MKVKKLLVMLVAVAMMASMMIPAQTSAVDTYTPNRMITLTCVDNINPTFRISLLYDNYADAGPYTILGKVKIENFADIAGNDLHKGFLDFCVIGGSPVNKSNWMANTDGWVELKNDEGKFIKFDNLTDDTDIIFGMWYAAGSLSLADFMIVDSDGNIVYSMANDPSLYGNTNTMQPTGICPWSATDYGSNKTSTVKTTTNMPEYVPNRIFTIEPTVPVVVGTTCINPVIIVDSGNALFAEGGPFTINAKIKVDDYGAIPDEANTPNVFMDPGLVNYYGNTDGWASLVKKDGTPITFATGSGWYNIGAWYCSAKISIADLTIYNAAGTAVYSAENDVEFTGSGTIPPKTAIGFFYFWFYGTPGGVAFNYSNAVTATVHSAADYILPTFNETVGAYNDPLPTATPTTQPTATPTTQPTAAPTTQPTAEPTSTENPQTDEGGSAVPYVGMIILAFLAASSYVMKKVKN